LYISVSDVNKTNIFKSQSWFRIAHSW